MTFEEQKKLLSDADVGVQESLARALAHLDRGELEAVREMLLRAQENARRVYDGLLVLLRDGASTN